MNEIKIIYGTECSRCHQMMNFLPKLCEENGFMYIEENFEDSVFKNEIESLPLIVAKINEGETPTVEKYSMEDFISNFMPKWKK